MKIANRKKFCGNCANHNPYGYPTRIFCTTRYTQNKDPIVDTLWCCNCWNSAVQGCHCVRDALVIESSAIVKH
jgi:hypothetical protein